MTYTTITSSSQVVFPVIIDITSSSQVVFPVIIDILIMQNLSNLFFNMLMEV